MIDYSKYYISVDTHEQWHLVCRRGAYICKISNIFNQGDTVMVALDWITDHEAKEHSHDQAEAHSDEPAQPIDTLVTPAITGKFQICLGNDAIGVSFSLDRAEASQLRDQLNTALRVHRW